MAIENNSIQNIGAILLAAGGSSRLGNPKQNLKYGGQTLLQHSLHAVLQSGTQPVIVVLGAYADIVKKDVEHENIHITINDEWEEGIASSIRTGLKTLLLKDAFVDGAIITLCDQPFITSALLSNLMETYRKTGKHIVACDFGNTVGPPAFFHNSMFPELLQLTGDLGAKGLIREHASQTTVISFPEGNIDIDTKEDYLELSKSNLDQ